jgi:hypothetical protein
MIKVIERPKIKLKEIEIEYSDKVPNDKSVDYNSEQYGKYPYVYYDGITIEADKIKKLVIYNDKIIPTIELEFTDPSNKMIDEKYPIDDAIISIFINSSSELLMPIRMDFKILEINTIKGKNNAQDLTFSIFGAINVNDLYIQQFEAFKNTSYKVLKDIVAKMELGFSTNIDDTDDSMTWINAFSSRINFMKEIVEHSYKSDETFLFGYIDFYYNYNYIDIEKQLVEDISKQEQATDRTKIIKDGEEQLTKLTLSNHPDKENSNMYINKYTIDNTTTNINLIYGYSHYIEQFNKSDNKFNSFLLDSISETGQDKKIVMKGQPGDKNGLYTEHVQRTWTGKIDLDNVHKNYNYADIQNRNNLKFIQKLKMTIRLNKVNYNLYRFQKVNVELYNLANMGDTQKNNQNLENEKTNDYDDKIINKLSGEWLITAIRFNFSKNDGNYQEITLVKRELSTQYNFKNQ